MHIHFIAIGGSVMHAIALALQESGHIISGSDDAIYDPAYTRLQAAGLLPQEFGWFPDRIHGGLDAVVLGMHAKLDNPELIRAKELSIRVLSFPEFIYELSQRDMRIAVCGSHGKTSTSAFLTHILEYNALKPNFVVGGTIASLGKSLEISQPHSPWVIEGDEYLTSPEDLRSKFLHYKAQIVIITGIAWDHINVFPTYAAYVNTFQELIRGISSEGFLIYNAEDAELVRILEATPEAVCKCIPMQADYAAYTYSDSGMEIQFGGKQYVFDVFGQHNIRNIECAILAAELVGVSRAAAFQALTQFKGIAKRLEPISHSGKAKAYRDFAHAPSKMKATVSAFLERFGNIRTIAVYEFHTFSSTSPEFWPEYRGAFASIQEKYVFLDQKAFEAKGRKVDIIEMQKALQDPDIQYFTSKEELEVLWQSVKDANDTAILLMSSGNFAGASVNV